MLRNKRVLVTGGTGSLGNVLVRRLLGGELGLPESVTVFSRDEAKQHAMRLAFQHQRAATDEVIYDDWRRIVRFEIGDVADPHAIASVLRDADVVFHAAALKQVPTCEYHPTQAVRTNVHGAENVVRAIRLHRLPVETVVAVSTDKACKPVNVMGMTKALQERIFIQANLDCDRTRFVAARYGNVLASRGSVLPLFFEQIRNGGPLTLTTPEMTRFFMSLDQAVDTVLAALREAEPGEIYVPRIPSVRMEDLAQVLIGQGPTAVQSIGIRPGEKLHETLVSAEEGLRTVERGAYYVIRPLLPELLTSRDKVVPIGREYSSADETLPPADIEALLRSQALMPENAPSFREHMLA